MNIKGLSLLYLVMYLWSLIDMDCENWKHNLQIMSFQITQVLFGREVYASEFMIICHWKSDELKLSWERIRKHSCTREGNPNHTVPLQTSALHTFMHSIPGVLQKPGKLRFHRHIKTDKVSVGRVFMISNKETSCRVHKHTDGGPTGDD